MLVPAILAAALALRGLQESELPRAAEGFVVERLYSVPPEEGSWVAMAFDAAGGLIVSPEKGALRRLRVSGAKGASRAEKIEAPVGDAQGLLWAYDGLYLNGTGPSGTGFYRLRDRDGDGAFEDVRLLRKWEISMTEHGPHGIALGPDGKLYVVNGNYTPVPSDVAAASPHRNYREDLLLPRQWDATGHAVGLLAPGGVVLRTDADGREWELFCGGLRNAYDLAFNPDGELFTYDSDMERDLGTPWYRPTRVFHLVPGGEYGWRSGTGKWPSTYPDCLPGVVDIGRGSPTGVAFGTSGRFPDRYRRALFACDWAFGRILAVDVAARGAGYGASFEPFVTGQPLNVTDLEFGPDGALYFITGGRGTRSTLYRVAWTGPVGAVPARAPSAARDLRKRLEAGDEAPWPHLGSADRFIRTAARLALERQEIGSWRDRALAEQDARASLTALLALTRSGGKDDLAPFVDAMVRLDGKGLSADERQEALRLYALAFLRLAPPDAGLRARVLSRLDPLYPSGSDLVDRELAQVLAFLGAPKLVPRTLGRLAAAGSQEEATHYVFVLRTVREGWTADERRTYFEWFGKFADYRGDPGFPLFLRNIRSDALATMTEEERKPLASLLEGQFRSGSKLLWAGQGPVVREWKMEDLVGEVERAAGRRNFMRGKASFAKAQCLACHRLGGEGGAVGPDLSGISRRFGRRDLLEAILLPSKVVSEQYQNTLVQTRDEEVFVGRVLDEDAEKLTLAPDPLGEVRVTIPKPSVRRRKPSSLSPMPEGLLNTLDRLEVLDLMAYLEAEGQSDHARFQSR